MMAALVVFSLAPASNQARRYHGLPRSPLNQRNSQKDGRELRANSTILTGVTRNGSRTNVASHLDLCGVDVTISRNLDSSSLVRVWSGVAGSQSYRHRGGR